VNDNSKDLFARYVRALDALDLDPEHVKSTSHTSAVTVRQDDILELLDEDADAGGGVRAPLSQK